MAKKYFGNGFRLTQVGEPSVETVWDGPHGSRQMRIGATMHLLHNEVEVAIVDHDGYEWQGRDLDGTPISWTTAFTRDVCTQRTIHQILKKEG